MTFEEATAKLSPRESRKVGNNTYLKRRSENSIAVMLHATDVVTFTPEYAELNTGGWYTVTTKDRINGYIPSPARVSSDRGRWYVYVGGWGKENRQPFFDGIRISYDGRVLNPMATAEDDAAAKEAAKLKRKISKYAKLCNDTLAAGMPQPGSGDCWYCLMRTEEGATLGDAHEDTGHLLSHMEEGYVVPSLLANAIVERGYGYPGVILGVNDDGTMGGGRWNHDIRRDVSNYLKRRLLPNETGAKPTGTPRAEHWAGTR